MSTMAPPGAVSVNVMVPVGILPPERFAVSVSGVPLPTTNAGPATVLMVGLEMGDADATVASARFTTSPPAALIENVATLVSENKGLGRAKVPTDVLGL